MTRVQVKFQYVEMRYDDKQNNILYEALIELGEEVALVAKLHGVDYGEVVTVGDIQSLFPGVRPQYQRGSGHFYPNA